MAAPRSISPNGVPHSPQNFASPTRAAPQDWHISPSRLPQSRQNFVPAGFSAWQLAQITPAQYRLKGAPVILVRLLGR
ncbi:MAG: hypothetical protein M3472_00890 [Chloroflexota bacterium]|nr:hypothetical protein [Chloroflexota bacterium]